MTSQHAKANRGAVVKNAFLLFPITFSLIGLGCNVILSNPTLSPALIEPPTLIPIDFYKEDSESAGWTNYAVELVVENGSQWLSGDSNVWFVSLPVSSGVVHTEQGVDYPASVETCEPYSGENWLHPYCYRDGINLSIEVLPPHFRVRNTPDSKNLLRFKVASTAIPTSVDLPEFGTIELSEEFTTPEFPVDDSLKLDAYELGEAISIPGNVTLTFANVKDSNGSFSVPLTVTNPDLYRQSGKIPSTSGYIINAQGVTIPLSSSSFSFSYVSLGPGVVEEGVWGFAVSKSEVSYMIVQSGFSGFLVHIP